MIDALEALIQQDPSEVYGDGYSNEYQRAMAVSQMTRTKVDETPKAKELVLQGKVVVLEHSPAYCRITDAVIGENTRIVVIADDRETAVGLTMNQFDPDCRYTVLPEETPAPAPVLVVADDDDNVPF